MPTKTTKKRAQSRKRRGNEPSTQAGEYVREEMHHKRSGKHGKMSRKQAVAIGLSKARRAGVNVPKKGAKKSASKSRSHGSRSSSRRPASSSSSRSRSKKR